MDADQARYLAARAARLEKDRRRPRFRGIGSPIRGLLPEEIDAFFEGVRDAVGRADREYREHVKRTGKVDPRYRRIA